MAVIRDLKSAQTQILALMAELEATKKLVKSTETKIEIQDYKGKPVLSFTGAFRPFHVGSSKLKAIIEMEAGVKKFLETKGKAIS